MPDDTPEELGPRLQLLVLALRFHAVSTDRFPVEVSFKDDAGGRTRVKLGQADLAEAVARGLVRGHGFLPFPADSPPQPADPPSVAPPSPVDRPTRRSVGYDPDFRCKLATIHWRLYRKATSEPVKRITLIREAGYKNNSWSREAVQQLIQLGVLKAPRIGEVCLGDVRLEDVAGGGEAA